MTISVVTIEDDTRYRNGLRALLEHAPGFELAGCFDAPAAALAALDALAARGEVAPWRLVLMDLGLPGMSGIECTRVLRQRLPDASIVVLTVFEDRNSIIQAICAGADGYLLKRLAPEPLLAQLRSVVNGGSPLSAGVARTVLDLVRHLGPSAAPQPSPGTAAEQLDLTGREHDVLRCLVAGRSYKAVALELDISIDTVRSHIRSIYRKLQVHSVAEAIVRALREGIV